MKRETRSFYERIVHRAVAQVVRGLDAPVDLADLARGARLSPLHFHRIFREIAGETPVALHRRVRLERAAWELASSDARVTGIALDAGYSTHESFTRSFREAYGTSPSEFRALARRAALIGALAPRIELGAGRWAHFEPWAQTFLSPLARVDAAIEVVIEALPERRVAAVPHVGPCSTIYRAFQRLIAIASASGLMGPDATLITVYHDAIEDTPEARLRSSAGILVSREVSIPAALRELRIPAGRYARTTHVGGYDELRKTWPLFKGECLPSNVQCSGAVPPYELYRPLARSSRDELRTELYLSVA